MKEFTEGFRSGLPIGLGYLSVSFTFGIIAVKYGLTWWEALIISMLTVTSAGQFAGITVMMNPGHYMEMLISQCTINVRYSFMSISLSQRVNERFKGIWRWIFAFMITDEIFAVASARREVTRSFFAGLCVLPYLGWSVGTLIGALMGNILPHPLMSALGMAIYGMFVAIVVPDLKKGQGIVFVVVTALVFSCLFTYVPGLNNIPAGISISICAVVAAIMGAVIYPEEAEDSREERQDIDDALIKEDYVIDNNKMGDKV